MPLPKPSKIISKRFKKTPKFAIPPSPSKLPWPPHPSRECRIRVVCTDPDATDDSSADEADPSPSPSIARKRLIHEVCLPLPSPSPPTTPHNRGGRSLSCRTPSRSLCRDFENCKAEANALLDAAAASSSCPPSPRSSSSSSTSSLSSSTECAGIEEEFIRFLREFLPEQEEANMWDCDVGRWGWSQDGNSAGEILDLELDSEALSWMESMQRLP